MKLNKKATALLLGLTLGISGTAFAADGADSFSDVPQGHWAYDALDYLAKDGVIDGMGDGTFQGNRTMTRYEMASIVAKAMQKGNLGVGDQAVLEKLEKEYGSELATLSKQVNANTKAIKDLNAKTDKFKIWGMARVQAGDDSGLQKESSLANDWNNHKYNGDYNNRFYMDLEGQMKINDHAVARFTIEKNARYNDKEYVVKQSVSRGVDGNVVSVSPISNQWWHNGTMAQPITGESRDMPDADTNHSGLISNIWVELQLGPKHDWYTNIGRKWNGIGMQNLLLGGQVDGIATYHPIEHGHGWWMSAQYWKSASDTMEYNLKYDMYYKHGDGSVTTTQGADGTPAGYGLSESKVYARRAPVNATLDFWGPLGKYIDANIGYTRIVGHKYNANSTDGYWYDTSGFFNADLAVKLFKDFKVTGSYVKAFTNEKSKLGHGDRDLAVRFDYRGTDLNKVGSWGAYAKWMNLGGFADLGHDDEWSTREPTYTTGLRGWYFGFKCVPAHNVEWETMWAPNLKENFTYDNQVKRHILRSWLDFHF